ncbi:tyrosine-type recombinase/integrase [Allonocardiopsis opalescens]|uniref:Phage integrase family protein n=1 Tax=Allonocardiopsis opalescens TaxID=1144618 RepID=A0A2T0Q739_9ACTN|nr:tyrosine-type recombinase/integrase [Allonocardiopsis opalescens]PRX99650.1 phage integrase family protein [Allonocardiopsis opalescens]
MKDTTYKVRVWQIETYTGKKGNTYSVRWIVAGKRWRETFANSTQADGFRSELVTAQRQGEAFSLVTGRPVSWQRDEDVMRWYAFMLAYADMKWPHVSPNHRRSIAEALTDATEVLVHGGSSPPSREALRAALREWAFSTRIRDKEPLPDEHAHAIRWLTNNTVFMHELTEAGSGPRLVRSVLTRISSKQDGTSAAANTANRKRMVINNAMEYAQEINVLTANPLKAVKWTRQRTAKSVNPAVVINSRQAKALLAAVGEQGERGRRLVAFFALMYYAAMRPEEIIYLRRANLVSLPDTGWGWARLTSAAPRSGSKWTDSGKSREERALKHRADGDTRSVPLHPELVAILVAHLKEFGTGFDGRLFVGPRGGDLAEWAYYEVLAEARRRAFTAEEVASPLAEDPYTLRHAAVSTWLSAGVNPAQVAEWAGHSVDVLLRVYAKCIAGQEHDAMRRIEDATKPPLPHGGGSS